MKLLCVRLFLFMTFLGVFYLPAASFAQSKPVVICTIDGPINPATDDYLRTSLDAAKQKDAALFIVVLNTPGGVLTSMQTMVRTIFESPIPTVVYVSPGGAGAISAGAFITLAGNYAVMAPGTTIGAAHPVTGTGGDIQGHMGEKIENFAASFMIAIAEQRKRNVDWAEKAVRESIVLTDREALDEKVIDFIAPDIGAILRELEGKTVTIKEVSHTFSNLSSAPRETIEMSFKQTVVNLLADPNLVIILTLGAMLGIGIELLSPGVFLPGIVGVICLVLTLAAGQVVPINTAGILLLLLAGVFFAVEAFIPSFGLWGAAGIFCLILGSIYFVDSSQVFGTGMAVDTLLIGSIAGFVGILLLGMLYLIWSSRGEIVSGKESLVGQFVRVESPFVLHEASGEWRGKVRAQGSLWNAKTDSAVDVGKGAFMKVQSLESGFTLVVQEVEEE